MSKVAVMYSGGLDSLAMYHYAKAKGYDPICVNVDFGHEYSEKEHTSITTESEWHPKVHQIKIDGLWDLIKGRLSNQIIPSRNVLLAVIGSMVAPRVWLGALEGEQNGKEHDKSDKFFYDATNLLAFTNEFFQPDTIIEAPFRYMTKGDVVGWCLEYGIPEEVLFNTSSCYHPTEQKCGKCLTCAKRYLAFLENGIEEPGYTVKPLESEYMKELMVEIPKAVAEHNFSRFTERRAESFIKLMNELGYDL